MSRLMLHNLGAIAVTLSLLIVTPSTAIAQTSLQAQAQDPAIMRRPIPRAALAGSLNFARTELFFGTAKADGTVVSDREFNRFVDAIVTPRFPDGLTLLEADGQFRNAEGDVIKEKSFVLILLYPVEDFRDASRRIDVIRERYKARFQQESVLRVDDPFAVKVSF
jgi:Protein of unknown function (DUF3574)